MKAFFVACASFATVAAALALSASGCGNSDPPAGCASIASCPTPDPATTQLTTPSISFKTDVVPLFQQSCALSTSCHQDKVGGPSGLYLGGSSNSPADPAGVYAAIVGVASIELPSMQYVKAGDLANSFLMHKMDGNQCQFSAQCGATPAPNCGDVMPQSSCPLTGAQRDTVRRWIAQGAQNN